VLTTDARAGQWQVVMARQYCEKAGVGDVSEEAVVLARSLASFLSAVAVMAPVAVRWSAPTTQA
jgi:hypothetical protein